MTRRTMMGLLATAAAVVTLAGCGGGGGGGGGEDTSDPTASVAPVAAPTAGVGAVPTDQLYGTPGAPDGERLVRALPGYDQFGTPRDGFIQIVSGTASGSSSGGAPVDPTVTGPQPTSTPPPTTTGPTTTAPPVAGPTAPAEPTGALYEADFDIGGEPIVARAGEAIPPGSQQFTVTTITATTVTLTLNGGLLPDGSDTVKMHKGSRMSLQNTTDGTTYTIRLLDIRRA